MIPIWCHAGETGTARYYMFFWPVDSANNCFLCPLARMHQPGVGAPNRGSRQNVQVWRYLQLKPKTSFTAEISFMLKHSTSKSGRKHIHTKNDVRAELVPAKTIPLTNLFHTKNANTIISGSSSCQYQFHVKAVFIPKPFASHID